MYINSSLDPNRSLDLNRMSKRDKAVFTLGIMFMLAGGVAVVALNVYMILKTCIG